MPKVNNRAVAAITPNVKPYSLKNSLSLKRKRKTPATPLKILIAKPPITNNLLGYICLTRGTEIKVPTRNPLTKINGA